jgi:hypothetical protein
MPLPDWYPGAVKAPLNGWENRRYATDLGNRLFTGHTIVGYFQSAIDMFRANGYNGVYSHFVCGGNGELVQLMALSRAAGADFQGSSWTISVECADHGPMFPRWSGSDVPALTAAQVKTLTGLCGWLVATGHVPARVATSSCERGLGYHRLGVPGYKPAVCPALSKALYKACPGDNRITQYKSTIFPAALRGVPLPEQDWLAMATRAEVRAEMDAAIAAYEKRAKTDLRNVVSDHRGRTVEAVNAHTTERTNFVVAWLTKVFQGGHA